MVELALWDTAGQEEYDRLRPLSYPETDVIFVCFAIDCPNSLENVMDKVRRRQLVHRASANNAQWYPEVLHFCPTTPLMLLGLKSDLRNKKNCIELLKTQGLTPVTTEQGRAVAKKMGAAYMECSSKEQDGVEEIFDMAVTMAVGEEHKEQEERRVGHLVKREHISVPRWGRQEEEAQRLQSAIACVYREESISRFTTLDDTIKMFNDHIRLTSITVRTCSLPL
jgi:GTPase SAR1 family protein